MSREVNVSSLKHWSECCTLIKDASSLEKCLNDVQKICLEDGYTEPMDEIADLFLELTALRLQETVQKNRKPAYLAYIINGFSNVTVSHPVRLICVASKSASQLNSIIPANKQIIDSLYFLFTGEKPDGVKAEKQGKLFEYLTANYSNNDDYLRMKSLPNLYKKNASVLSKATVETLRRLITKSSWKKAVLTNSLGADKSAVAKQLLEEISKPEAALRKATFWKTLFSQVGGPKVVSEALTAWIAKNNIPERDNFNSKQKLESFNK